MRTEQDVSMKELNERCLFTHRHLTAAPSIASRFPTRCRGVRESGLSDTISPFDQGGVGWCNVVGFTVHISVRKVELMMACRPFKRPLQAYTNKGWDRGHGLELEA